MTAAVLLAAAGCGEIAYSTKLAGHPEVRAEMLRSVVPGSTTEGAFTARWGNPAQKIREGGQVSYVYRDMTNPPGWAFPAFGDSTEFVVAVFQYRVAIGAYSSDTQGCRATFPPRPPGPGFDNPTTVYPVNCVGGPAAAIGYLSVPGDDYRPGGGKY